MPKKRTKRTEEEELKARFDEYYLCKKLLEIIYSEAKSSGKYLEPDDAMRELTKRIQKLAENQNLAAEIEDKQMDVIAYWHKIHTHAVNLHYRTYSPRKGAPPLSKRHDNKLLEMYDKEGLTFKQIAIKLEPDLKTPEEIKTAEDKYRKRYQAAKRRKSTS